MMAYTYRDPLDDYNSRLRNSEAAKPPPPESGHRGGMAGAFIAIAVVGVMMAYGANRSSSSTTTGPSTILVQTATVEQCDSDATDLAGGAV
jgi:hypothetical protein